MAKFSELTPEEQRAQLAKSGHGQAAQTTIHLNSDSPLVVGVKVTSLQEFNTWHSKNRNPLELWAQDGIYKPDHVKEFAKTRAEIKAQGLSQYIISEERLPDFSTLPEPWEVEAYATRQSTIYVDLKRQKAGSKWSFDRMSVFLADYYRHYTVKSLDDLINECLEDTRNTWEVKSKFMQSSDAQTIQKREVSETSDGIGQAAQVIASHESKSIADQHEALMKTDYRNKFVNAKNLLASVKAFK